MRAQFKVDRLTGDGFHCPIMSTKEHQPIADLRRVRLRSTIKCALGCSATFLSQIAAIAQPSLTIYNQNFAVVRDIVELDLKAGINQVSVSGTTAFLEPASVVLRDPAARTEFRILEQNYRADPVSQELLLSLNEGKTIRFEVGPRGGETAATLVSGRIVRSGYFLPSSPRAYYNGQQVQPLIEVNGELRFELPGTPLFPALADNTILTPTLDWTIEAAAAVKFFAELSYITEQLSWEADYNLVLPEKGDTLDIAGWVTVDNQSGKSFPDAHIKLMAGDVAKIAKAEPRLMAGRYGSSGGGGGGPAVTEKTFDEYHLYALGRPTTLLDAQKKQVEFVRAEGVKSRVFYTYDGADLTAYADWQAQDLNTDATFGTAINKKIVVTREFENTKANHLDLPLPKGRLRVYRRDADGRLEFTGENTIDHTPRDEIVRLNTGFAFDLVGERRRTHLNVHSGSGAAYFTTDPRTGQAVAVGAPAEPASKPFVDESFEITLRNRKQAPVEIRVVEHLYRGANWEIRRPSNEYTKLDARTIEFRVKLDPGKEKQVEYSVHYTW